MTSIDNRIAMTYEEYSENYGDETVHMTVRYWHDEPENNSQDDWGVKEHDLYYVWRSMKRRSTKQGIPMFPPWERDCREFYKYCADCMPEKGKLESVQIIDSEKGFFPGNIEFRHHLTKTQ